MRTLSPRLILCLLMAFWWMLFGVKINIVDLGGSGVRLDDVIFALSVPLLIMAIPPTSLPRPFVTFCLFVLTSLLSLLLGAIAVRISLIEGILYWFRNLQYVSFFLLGLLLAQRLSLERMLRAYTLYLVIFIALQYFNLLPSFSAFVGSSRAIANTGGPYELAAIAALLGFFFWHQARNRFYFVCAIVILVMTQSRITLAAFVLVMFALGVKTRGRIVGLSVGLAAALVFSFVDLAVLDRFAGLFDEKTLQTFVKLLGDIPSFPDTWGYRDWAFSTFMDALPTDGDTSAIIRFTRQFSLIQSTLNCGTECVLFGLGPSFAVSAVDGNLVRLFVEYGVIGTLLFLVGTWQVAKRTGNRTVISYYVLLVITAFAIDILVSSKAMSLFWFLCGYYWQRRLVASAQNAADAPLPVPA